MENLLSKTPYKFKKSYGGTPEPQTPQDAPWLRGPSLKKYVIIRFYVAWGPSCDGERCGYIFIYKSKKYRREGIEPARGTHS